MSQNYNRLFLTACVSIVTLSFYVNSPAQAGFDWTPPEASQPAQEKTMPSAGSVLPVPPVQVEKQVLDQTPMSMPIPEEPIKAQTPMMKTRVIDMKQTPSPMPMAMPPAKTVYSPPQKQPKPVQHQTSFERKKIVPQPLPTQQPATPAVSEQHVYSAPINEQSASSVPRRVKPKMPTQQANRATAKSVEMQQTMMQNAKEILPPPEQTNNTMPEQPKGLKINPYPRGNKSGSKSMTPSPENNASEGDQALESVYKGNEKIKWNENSEASYPVIEGFGTDIPLALALSQIVPPSYAYSFGDGVNPGLRVSWSGGKPWNEVLSDVLAPLSIDSEVSGKTVMLRKMGSKQATNMPRTGQQNGMTSGLPVKKKLNN